MQGYALERVYEHASPPVLMRTRCEEHGVVYDPETAQGCVLCRRSIRAAPSSERHRALALGGMLVVVLFVAIGVYLVSSGAARNLRVDALAPKAASSNLPP